MIFGFGVALAAICFGLIPVLWILERLGWWLIENHETKEKKR